jgi:O-antigen biosynthesis protein WbqP
VTRPLELLLSLVAAALFAVPAIIVAIAVRLTSPGPVLYWSERVGRGNRIFLMPKFRTMRLGTPALATHLLGEPDSVLTPIGGLLRKTSLDELPQLWSVLRGDMTFVGPRPALFNQYDLISMRTNAGVHHLKPGITGWAQVEGRDAVSLEEKVELDRYYLEHRSFILDLQILVRTLLKLFGDSSVSH